MSADDVDRAMKIFGPPEPLLKGTMIYPSQVTHRNRSISIPIEILQKNKNLRLFCDICFVNGLPFLVTRTDIVEFITIHHMANRKKKEILLYLKNISKIYFSRGFIVTDMYADGEFNLDSIKHGILPVTLNICATGEHVSKLKEPSKP